jgi:hypothetical protein
MKRLEAFLQRRTGRDLNWWVQRGSLAARHPVLLSKRLSYNLNRSASDVFSAMKYYDYQYKIIFLVGMSAGGTTWMKNLLARIPGYYTRHMPMPLDVSYRQDIVDSAFNRLPKYGYTLFKTHIEPKPENLDCMLRNGVEKILVMYRDFRDVAVSRYYRLINFPKPSDAFDFVDYRTIGKEKALLNSIDVVAKECVPWIEGWHKLAREETGRYHFTKFEDLKNDTKGEFQRVLKFYGIELSEKKVEEIVDAAKGRGAMNKNIDESRILPWGHASNFRSGKVGGWKNEFSEAHIRKCKGLLGGSLIELAYEKDLNW